MKKNIALKATKLFELFLLQRIQTLGGTVHIARLENEFSEGAPQGIVSQTINHLIAIRKLRLLGRGKELVTLTKYT